MFTCPHIVRLPDIPRPCRLGWYPKPLPRDLLPHVIAQTDDRNTLATLARVCKRAHKIILPILYHTVELQTAKAHVRFFRAHHTKRGAKWTWPVRTQYLLSFVKHLDVIIDSNFTKDEDFASSRARSLIYGFELPMNLKTLNLITKGPSWIAVDRGLIRPVEEYDLCDLIHMFMAQTVRNIGPEHFKWRHVLIKNDKFYDPPTLGDDILDKEEGEEMAFPSIEEMWWITERWVNTISIEWPKTRNPARDIMRITRPVSDQQNLEYLTLPINTISRRFLRSLADQLRSIAEERSNEDDLKVFTLELRDAEGINDGVVQNIRQIFVDLPAGSFRLKFVGGNLSTEDKKLPEEQGEEWRLRIVNKLWRWDEEDWSLSNTLPSQQQGQEVQQDVLAPFIQELEQALGV